MSTHQPSKQYPALHWKRYARNGLPVLAPLMKAASEAINHCYAFRGQKCVLMYSRDWNNVASPATGTVSMWRAHFRAPYGAELFRCMIAMHPVSDHYGAVDPYMRVQLKHSGGTITSNGLHYAAQDSSGGITAAVPESVYWGLIPAVTIVPNTIYELTVQAVDWALPLACMAWTDPALPIDDADTAVVDPSYSVSLPITDAQHADLLVACNNLWDRSAAQLFSWTSDRVAASPSFTSTTYTNVLDTTSTGSAGTSTPGFQLQTRYKARQSVATVPATLAIYGAVTAGGGTGKARLVDTSGNQFEVTGIAAAGWYTASVSLLATDDYKLDLHAAVSAAGTTVRIDAASLYQER